MVLLSGCLTMSMTSADAFFYLMRVRVNNPCAFPVFFLPGSSGFYLLTQAYIVSFNIDREHPQTSKGLNPGRR